MQWAETETTAIGLGGRNGLATIETDHESAARPGGRGLLREAHRRRHDFSPSHAAGDVWRMDMCRTLRQADTCQGKDLWFRNGTDSIRTNPD
jgi:hypothetical protein